MSHEQNPGCGYIGDEILPSYVGVLKKYGSLSNNQHSIGRCSWHEYLRGAIKRQWPYRYQPYFLIWKSVHSMFPSLRRRRLINPLHITY